MSSSEQEAAATQTALHMANDLWSERTQAEQCACGARYSTVPGWSHYCDAGCDRKL